MVDDNDIFGYNDANLSEIDGQTDRQTVKQTDLMIF